MKYFFSGICIMWVLVLRSVGCYFFDSTFFASPTKGVTSGSIVTNDQNVIYFGTSGTQHSGGRYLQQSQYNVYYGNGDNRKSLYYSDAANLPKETYGTSNF